MPLEAAVAAAPGAIDTLPAGHALDGVERNFLSLCASHGRLERSPLVRPGKDVVRVVRGDLEEVDHAARRRELDRAVLGGASRPGAREDDTQDTRDTSLLPVEAARRLQGDPPTRHYAE